MNGQHELQPGEKFVDLTNHAGETPTEDPKREEEKKTESAPPPGWDQQVQGFLKGMAD